VPARRLLQCFSTVINETLDAAGRDRGRNISLEERAAKCEVCNRGLADCNRKVLKLEQEKRKGAVGKSIRQLRDSLERHLSMVEPDG
jgi:hypothetical protein